MAKIKLFLALSRTPHGLLDMAAPLFAAILWLGKIPPIETLLIGMAAVFSGYTSVYALNDVIGYQSDKKKCAQGGLPDKHQTTDLDAVMVRHPMARGLLSFGEGAAWATFWGVAAIICAYMLNPVCVVIFMLGCLLEVIYCLLWRISPYRAIVNGVVKTLGSIAAVFAVDPTPSPVYLMLLFSTLFFWEIGGQNIPNDWSDYEEDREFGAKTFPVYFGFPMSDAVIQVSLIFASGLGMILFFKGSGGVTPWLVLGYIPMIVLLLLIPAWRLHRTQGIREALALFNRASYFPLFLLALTLIVITGFSRNI